MRLRARRGCNTSDRRRSRNRGTRCAVCRAGSITVLRAVGCSCCRIVVVASRLIRLIRLVLRTLSLGLSLRSIGAACWLIWLISRRLGLSIGSSCRLILRSVLCLLSKRTGNLRRCCRLGLRRKCSRLIGLIRGMLLCLSTCRLRECTCNWLCCLRFGHGSFCHNRLAFKWCRGLRI